MKNSFTEPRGFTLIELSIVLVIIGLIVGGVLVGQNLIGAATVRAQVTQIEQYNSAVNTFYGKYGALPGDMTAATATTFGFKARGSLPGTGDGNGVLQGVNYGGSGTAGYAGTLLQTGEAGLFWVDLNTANLAATGLTTASGDGSTGCGLCTPDKYMPKGKITSTYVYDWSGGYSNADNVNYFGISAVSQVGNTISATTGLSVPQASSIDQKIDDGLPQSGRVLAMYVDNYSSHWAAPGEPTGSPYTTATASSPSSCFDNGNNAGAAQTYSVGANAGSSATNCALSFRFQ